MNITSSPLVAMAREAKRPTPWWLAWPVGIAIIFGGLIAGDLLGEAILRHPDPTNPIHQFIDLTGFGMIVLLLALWLRMKEGRSFSSVGLRGSNPVGKLVGGLAIGAGMMTLGVVVPWAMGQYELGASAHARLGPDAVLWLIPLFAVFILQGSTEGLVLRGYMLQTGGLQMPGLAAILGTSLWSFGPAQGSNVALTGGNFGVEASLMGTAVLMVALVVAVFNYRATTKQRA